MEHGHKHRSAVRMRPLRPWVLVLAIIVAAVFTVQEFVLPAVTVKAIHTMVQKDCPKCRISVSSVHYSLFSIPAKVVVNGLSYQGDPKSLTVLNFAVDEARVRFDLISALKKDLNIEIAEFEGLKVVARETEGGPVGTRPDFPEPGAAFGFIPPARIGGVRVHSGEFTYEAVIPAEHDQVGKIQLDHIDAVITNFVTRQFLLPRAGMGTHDSVLMDADALLEHSGKVNLHVEFQPFAEDNHDRIEITARDQNMKGLDHFFMPEDGISLSGKVVYGHAALAISRGHLTGSLYASYRGLKVDFHRDRERGRFTAFFTNLFERFQMNHDDAGTSEKIDERRKPKEVITQFLVRALRDAAMGILTSR